MMLRIGGRYGLGVVDFCETTITGLAVVVVVVETGAAVVGFCGGLMVLEGGFNLPKKFGGGGRTIPGTNGPGGTALELSLG